MNKKVIQVPIEADLLSALNLLSKQEGRSRADVIREACRRYLKYLEEKELDRTYQDGYARIPESPALGQMQASLTGGVLPEETW